MIAPGDIWEVGSHVFACGDLERGDALRFLDEVGEPDIVFTDPPWNSGIARQFRNWANVGRPVNFDALLVAVVAATRRSKRDAFIEMGYQGVDRLKELVAAAGGEICGEWNAYYGSGPYALIRVCWNGHKTEFNADPSELKGQDVPRVTIQAATRPNETVFDPCVGKGDFALVTAQLGRVARGTELNPKRLEECLRRISRLTGDKPTKVGELNHTRGEEG